MVSSYYRNPPGSGGYYRISPGSGVVMAIANGGGCAGGGGNSNISTTVIFGPKIIMPPMDDMVRPLDKIDIPDKGIVMGEIEAWRLWRPEIIPTGDVYLKSLSMGIRWDKNEPMTGDPDLAFGKWSCHPGVYALKTLQLAQEHAHVVGGSPLVLGRVALWGVVHEHENGYRASHARIISLDYIRGIGVDPKIIEKFRHAYGVTGDSVSLPHNNLIMQHLVDQQQKSERRWKKFLKGLNIVSTLLLISGAGQLAFILVRFLTR